MKDNKYIPKSQESSLKLLKISEVMALTRRRRTWILSNLHEFEIEKRLLFIDKHGSPKYQIFFTLCSVEAAIKRWLTPKIGAKTARQICQEAIKE